MAQYADKWMSDFAVKASKSSRVQQDSNAEPQHLQQEAVRNNKNSTGFYKSCNPVRDQEVGSLPCVIGIGTVFNQKVDGIYVAMGNGKHEQGLVTGPFGSIHLLSTSILSR